MADQRKPSRYDQRESIVNAINNPRAPDLSELVKRLKPQRDQEAEAEAVIQRMRGSYVPPDDGIAAMQQRNLQQAEIDPAFAARLQAVNDAQERFFSGDVEKLKEVIEKKKKKRKPEVYSAASADDVYIDNDPYAYED